MLMQVEMNASVAPKNKEVRIPARQECPQVLVGTSSSDHDVLEIADDGSSTCSNKKADEMQSLLQSLVPRRDEGDDDANALRASPLATGGAIRRRDEEAPVPHGHQPRQETEEPCGPPPSSSPPGQQTRRRSSSEPKPPPSRSPRQQERRRSSRRRSSLGDDDCERVASMAVKHVREYKRRSSFRDVAREGSVKPVPVDDVLVGELLGSGSFNNVYQARIRAGDGCYALKQLKLQVMSDPDEYATGAVDLAMEAKLLSSMCHENIVKLHGVTAGSILDAFSSGLEGSYFLVLDKMESSLTDRMGDWAAGAASDSGAGASSSPESKDLRARLDVALGVARGLEYLHSHNIVYRDLKPDNIGFVTSGVVKIFDFGLARELLPDDGRRPTGMAGTIRYMAPEVALSQRYGLSADTHSFGLLLWEICALEKPYQSFHRSGRFSMKTWNEEVVRGTRRPRLKRSWPGGIRVLMGDCWARDASRRPEMGRVAAILDPESSVVVERERVPAASVLDHPPETSSVVEGEGICREEQGEALLAPAGPLSDGAEGDDSRGEGEVLLALTESSSFDATTPLESSVHPDENDASSSFLDMVCGICS